MTVDGTISQSTLPINLLDDIKLALLLPIAPFSLPPPLHPETKGVEFLNPGLANIGYLNTSSNTKRASGW